MKIIQAVFERHAPPMLELLNDAVLHTTWVYDCEPHPESFMREYFDVHAAGNYPVLAAESDEGAFLGFASCGAYRPHQGYRHSAEHSVYVVPSARRQGVGYYFKAAFVDSLVEKGINAVG